MTVPSSRGLENESLLSAFYLSTSFAHPSIHSDETVRKGEATRHEARTDRLALNKPGHGSKKEISGPLVNSDPA